MKIVERKMQRHPDQSSLWREVLFRPYVSSVGSSSLLFLSFLISFGGCSFFNRLRSAHFFVLAPEILTTILNRFKSPRLLESSAQAPRWHQQRFVGWGASMYVAALSSSVLSLLRTVRASIIIFLPPRLLLRAVQSPSPRAARRKPPRSILILPSRRTAARPRRIFSVRYWYTRPARYSPSSTTLEV